MELNSAIYVGTIRHRRFRPVTNAFRQRIFQLYLDLDELPTLFDGRWFWSVDRRNLASFRRRDYYGDPSLPLVAAVRARAAKELGRDVDGPVRLLTHARYFGVTMNPVSFYYGFESDGQTLSYVLAEITNTPWGERFSYVLDARTGRRRGSTVAWDFDKRFHVSPFVAMERGYRWRVSTPSESLRIHMDVLDAGEREFDATLSLTRRPFDARNLAGCLVEHPFLTARIAAAIYGHAARLAIKGAPFHEHPGTPRRSDA